MQAITKRFKQSEFLRHNAIMFSGSLAVSAVNYLYYPVLGRLLPVVQFGEVQVLATIFAQTSIFLGVVTNVAVNIVANERDDAIRNRTIYELERFAGVLMLVFVAVALIFVKPLQDFFQFPETAPFVALGLVLIASAPLSLRTAYLRGRQAFGRLSTTNLIGSIGKLLASTALVLLGLGTTGAIGGLVVAQLLALWYARRHARLLGLTGTAGSFFRKPDLRIVRPHLPYVVLVLIVSLIETTMYSFDIIIVKRLFSPEVAGLYAGVSTIARIIFFLTGSFAAVLLSSVRRDNTPAENHSLLKRSALLQIAIGGPALVVFVLLPELVIRLLVGSKYLAYAELLPILSTALFVLALINLLLNYDMALRRWSTAFVSIGGAIVMATLIYMNHASPQEIVGAILTGALTFLGLRLSLSVGRRLFHSNSKQA